jgi:hypothetical protein
MCWQGLTNLLFVSILVSTFGTIILTFLGLVSLRFYQHFRRRQRRQLSTFQGTHTL